MQKKLAHDAIFSLVEGIAPSSLEMADGIVI